MGPPVEDSASPLRGDFPPCFLLLSWDKLFPACKETFHFQFFIRSRIKLSISGPPNAQAVLEEALEMFLALAVPWWGGEANSSSRPSGNAWEEHKLWSQANAAGIQDLTSGLPWTHGSPSISLRLHLWE